MGEREGCQGQGWIEEGRGQGGNKEAFPAALRKGLLSDHAWPVSLCLCRSGDQAAT